VPWLPAPDLDDGGDDFPGHTQAAGHVVSRDVVRHEPEGWGQCAGSAAVLGLGSYETAWTWLHKLRRAMVRPGRDRLSGWIEVDETFLGGLAEGVMGGRQKSNKSLVVIAAQADGPGIGRIRMRMIPDATSGSLHSFVSECVEPGSTLHTDGWAGYAGLEKAGYQHVVTVIGGQKKNAAKLLPRVHRIASLLKRWLLGTHQGAVAPWQLPYYLDEFTFRFNRRTSRSRGKLFFRLMQHAVNTPPAPYEAMVDQAQPPKHNILGSAE
jgi:transposase-like protein